MKNFVLIICLLAASGCAVAQNGKPSDFTTGKYHEIPNKNKFKNKHWVASGDKSQLSFDMDVVKKDIKLGEVNYSTDVFQLKVKKLVFDGENVAPKIKEDILIFYVHNNKKYTGTFKDPVTNNYLAITIEYTGERTLTFTARVTTNPENNRAKGMIFPTTPITMETK